jgi:DNA-binding PadR family transcriptional regulator
MQLSAGTLYGLIKRLLEQELIAESTQRAPSQWDDERRRYYRLTELGRRVAIHEIERLERVVGAARSRQLEAGEVES